MEWWLSLGSVSDIISHMAYELMIIAKIDSAEEIFGKVEKFLKDIKAESLKIERLGKKLLAYPIAKQTEAEYFLYNFEAESQALKGLSDKIRLEETILRHLLIKAAKPRKASKRRNVETAAVEEEKIAEIKPKVTVTTKSSRTKEVTEDASKKAKKTVKSKKKGSS